LLTTGMHGVNTAVREAGRLATSSATTVFSGCCFIAGQLAASLSCPERDPRYDLSLARTGCTSQRLHPGVNAPGLQLSIRDLRFIDPFGF
jgi:hypothetical protein